LQSFSGLTCLTFERPPLTESLPTTFPQYVDFNALNFPEWSITRNRPFITEREMVKHFSAGGCLGSGVVDRTWCTVHRVLRPFNTPNNDFWRSKIQPTFDILEINYGLLPAEVFRIVPVSLAHSCQAHLLLEHLTC
jgi:hypothetical protein